MSSAHVYDATNPEARRIYWEHLPGKLLAQGWDAIWLDNAEPEEYWPHIGDAILSPHFTGSLCSTSLSGFLRDPLHEDRNDHIIDPAL